MTRRPWLVLVAMTGSLSMIMLDQTVVAVALPTMARELPLTPSAQQWVVAAYVLAIAALVGLGGKAADVLGRVRAVRAGVTVFLLASAGCALAWDGASLIACRSLQGAGAALMMPVSAAIVLSAFPAGQRGRVMALYAGIGQIFLALGPLVGGLLTEYASWRTVFLLNVPVGLVTLTLVALAGVPDRPVAGSHVRIGDALLVVAGLALLTTGVQQVAGWMACAGLALLGWFVVRQLRAGDPLIHLRLFADRGFTADATVMGLVQFGLLGLVVYSSVYLQEVLGLGPLSAGLAALPLILPLTLAAQVGGRWYDRSGVRAPVLAGLMACTAGVVAWLLALPLLDYAWQVPGMVLVGAGLGLTLSPTNTDALGRVPDHERSQASGVVQTVRQLGGALGVAVVGSVVATVGHAVPGRTGTADAIALGFGVAAVALALAVALGALLLRRTPDGTDTTGPVAALPADAQCGGAGAVGRGSDCRPHHPRPAISASSISE